MTPDEAPKSMADALALARSQSTHITVYGRPVADHAWLVAQIVMDHSDSITLGTAAILAAVPGNLRGLDVAAAFGPEVAQLRRAARKLMDYDYRGHWTGDVVLIAAAEALVWADHTLNWLQGMSPEAMPTWWASSTELTQRYVLARHWTRTHIDQLPVALGALLVGRMDDLHTLWRQATERTA